MLKLLFLIAGLGLVTGAVPAIAQSVTCSHFAGKWKSDYGPMVLKATPIKDKSDAYVVSGTYIWNGTTNRITGTANGGNFYGRWIQTDRWGYFSMVLSPDKTGFGGTWTEANKAGGGRWNGNCSS